MMARTPLKPDRLGWKSPLLRPGAEIAGLLLLYPDPNLAGTPILHGSSIFVFSDPVATERLDAYRETVQDLFRKSAAAMEAAQTK